MLDFNEMDALQLCALSYFDLVDYQQGMPFEKIVKGVDQQALRSDAFYVHLRDFIHEQDFSRFQDFYVSEYINRNNKSGLVFFVLENESQIILVIRGSEYLDELHHDCGWEDWRDNLEIFLGVTLQQLEISDWFNQYSTEKEILICGHSKGGNLALYLGVTCPPEKCRQIGKIITFNAPGINEDMMKQYALRIADPQFLAKCNLLENEHDCVSSFFMHIKEPIICQSRFDNYSINDGIANHQLYAFRIEENALIHGNHKSAMPFIVDQIMNQIFVKQSFEFKKNLIETLMEYIRGDLQKEELYHVMLYQVGKRRDLFKDYSEDEIRQIEIDTLLNGLTDNIRKQIEAVPDKLNKMFDDVTKTIQNKISKE